MSLRDGTVGDSYRTQTFDFCVHIKSDAENSGWGYRHLKCLFWVSFFDTRNWDWPDTGLEDFSNPFDFLGPFWAYLASIKFLPLRGRPPKLSLLLSVPLEMGSVHAKHRFRPSYTATETATGHRHCYGNTETVTVTATGHRKTAKPSTCRRQANAVPAPASDRHLL